MATKIHQHVIRLTGIFAIATLIGCQSNWHESHKEYSEPYEQGNLSQACDASTHLAQTGAEQDKILFNVEAGAILRSAGRLKDSNAAFDVADAKVGKYEDWPSVKISEEAGAALTTVRTITYRGNLCDLIMLNTYRALNDMELGDPAARNMLIRAAFVQQDIATKYAAQLAKEQDDLNKKKEENKNQFDVDQTVQSKDSSGMSLNQRLDNEQDKDLLNLKPYGNYVNPFCDYLQGIYFLGAGVDQSDHERAVTAFKRVASMVPQNRYVAQDVQEADRVANGSTPSPLTYVIFETGLAPQLGQVQIPLPLFLINRQAPSVVLFFPTIRARNDFVPSLNITAGGAIFQTAVVSNMDAVLVQEFKNELPTTITRMIIGAATKAIIDAGVEQGMKNTSPIAQLGVGVGMLVYQSAMNQADLRIWASLPKQFQVARFPTPPDRQLTIVPASGPPIAIKVGDSIVNVVLVKSIRPGVPLIVRQFQLQPEGTPTTRPASVATANPH